MPSPSQKKAAKRKAAVEKAAAEKKAATQEVEAPKYGAAAEMKDIVWDNLDEAFTQKKDEINKWKPDEVGEAIFGQIIQFGVSVKYKTPYLSVLEPDGSDLVVFVKSGLVNTFERKGWLNADGTWKESAFVENDGALIAIRYEGEQDNPATGRTFESYKVLFQEELPKSALAVFGVE